MTLEVDSWMLIVLAGLIDVAYQEGISGVNCDRYSDEEMLKIDEASVKLERMVIEALDFKPWWAK